MAIIRPFRGLRPHAGSAHRVISPPYDVLDELEARELVEREPDLFLRVTRPEADLPRGSDPHSAEAYGMARRNLAALRSRGVLVREERPAYYLYHLVMGDHSQVGLVATCSVEDYDAGRIRRHELTRPDKERDRTEHILATRCQTGLVFLAHRADPEVAALQSRALDSEPLFRVPTPDGVTHALHRVDDPGQVEAWTRALGRIQVLYIADGHHRSAAASRVARRLGGDGPQRWFLAGIFPDDQLQVMAYNRVVADLAGMDPAGFLRALEAGFEVARCQGGTPERRGEIRAFCSGRWWSLRARPGRVDPDDPVASLDAAILQDEVLGPILGIEDPRRDTRISFVGGIRGTGALEQAVRPGGAAVAFSLHPTGLDQLFAVADAGLLMPPKSTWFEPKLAGGVVAHPLEP